MTHNDDFIGRLEDYLDAFDGVTPLPDRVRDAIRAELPSARQVRPSPGLERVFTMLSNASGLARLGLAAAVLVVAVVLGGAFLNNRSGGIVGGASTPTPIPTSTIAPTADPTTPTQTPSPAALAPSLGSATYVDCDAADTVKSCLQPGRYRLDQVPGVWPATITVDVPQGWFEWSPGTGSEGILVDGGPRYRSATGWGVVFSTVGDVVRDPCDGSKGVIPAAQIDTPQKLAAAMAAWPKFAATVPEPVTIDGREGVRFRLSLKDKATCDGNPSGWLTTTGFGLDLYPMLGYETHAPGTFEIVDTGHGLLVIRTTDFAQTAPAEVAGGRPVDPAAHATDLARLRSMLDTLRIEPLPSS
jgi:hypothetical protein